MLKKNYPFNFIRKYLYHVVFSALVCAVPTQAGAQIYSHNFGTTAITAHPYTVAPTVLNTHLSNSSWSNSLNSWTSTAGAAGEAIRLTSTGNATITLTFNVAANFQASITSFQFWRQRSNLGPQNWSIAINGINVGNGTTGTTGASIGNTPVTNAISGLTGTVTVVISLTGNTGNGTFRLDDFSLNGTVTSSCTGSTIASFTPVSGPQNTLVTISGSGFLSGSGTSSVKFNGITASFTVVSDTVIKAYVPAGNATGDISVITNGCEGFSAVHFTKVVSVATPNYSSDIYISEIYDAQAGDGGVIEIYNGTANAVNLSGYTIIRYGDVGGPPGYTINLSGVIPAGGIFLIGIGTGTIPCSITQNQHYNTGFNSNDEFELYHGGTLIDNVQAPVNVGYSVVRDPNAVAPKPNFNSADWNTSTTESCANIGIHNVPVNNPPAIASPASMVSCDTNSATFSVSLANPNAYSYQWKTLNSSGMWVNVTNTSPYSGGNTATLTINPVAASFDDSQYYCQVSSPNGNAVSHAAQLEVEPIIIPDFPTALAFCYGETVPLLSTTSPNGVTGNWNPPVIDNTGNGSYVFTPHAGQCAANVTLNVTIHAATTPDFSTTLALCNGDTAPTLNPVSPNGISGTWNPAAIDNTTNGNYTFTPNTGQCANIVILSVTVNSRIVPDFATTLTICYGGSVPALSAISPNGISGTWSSTGISNTASGAYIFTPNPGQCAHSATLNVTVTNPTAPDFAPTLVVCEGDAVPVLTATSPNGISGTWNPAVIDNMTSGNYIFTPSLGQCATSAALSVTVTHRTIPDFVTTLQLCQGSAAPVLNAISPNGISGTWNPGVISNLNPGSYIFTPDIGQCAASLTLNVTINNPAIPDFNPALVICAGDPAPILSATSPNGISGIWNPAVIDNSISGNYIFTPNGGQCATNLTLAVTVNNPIVPDFNPALIICEGTAVPILNATSPNGIVGLWNPSTISNTASGSYTFTPNAGQCATTTALNVTVNSLIVPDFATALVLCTGGIPPVLNATSPNGITGTWNPAVISNTLSGNYVFTPNPGQCAASATLSVTITNSITPDFATSMNLCAGATAPALQPLSPNGITGIWNPLLIDNAISGNYTFTPNPGQCAVNVVLNVTVNPVIIPDFATALQLCAGGAAPMLPNISPNGIVGTWNPATISNAASANYIFAPDAGQCAAVTNLAVTVTNNITPDFPAVMTLCSGGSVPVLNPVSPNGISGTWYPTTVSNTTAGSYLFTPNSGQCATSLTLNVAVQNMIIPDFVTVLAICNDDAVPTLNGVSPNGISGIWNPSAISNSTSGNYTFTPNLGQCASSIVLTVTVNQKKVPNFATVLHLCSGSVAPNLNSISHNGVTGTWNPSAIDNQTSGTYIFTPATGQCATTATLHVTIDPLPNPLLQDGFICFDQSGQIINPANLYTGIPNAGYTFAWTLNGNALPAHTNTHLATEAGHYKVTVTNNSTGCTAVAEANINALTGFAAKVITGADFENDGTIDVVTTGGSGQFEFELDGTFTQQNGHFFNVNSGEHTVSVKDLNGCAEWTFEVFLLDYPRFFTPNADGHHDFWNIGGLSDQKDSKIYIFDRYGKLIKSLKPSDVYGWDGTYNGNTLPATDYWFSLFYRDKSGQDKTFQSHFSLKR